MTYRKDWAQPQVGPMGFVGTKKVIGRTVTISAADNVTGNTIGAFKLPPGFTVTGILGSATDMDAGAAMLITVGDAANAARYVASVSAQAAIASWTLAAAGLLFLNTVETEVLITIATQAATPAAGTATIYLEGFMAQ
jgi:hypothetical protein